MLGVLKAGGAYVPLDPAYTRDADERMKYVLQDAQVSLVLTDSALADRSADRVARESVWSWTARISWSEIRGPRSEVRLPTSDL